MLQVGFDQGGSSGPVSVLDVGMLASPVGAEEVRDELGEFAEQLLAALVVMASRSKRRQADLNAVLRRSKLQHDPERVASAITMLQQGGLIHEIVPLYDGGMLLSITSQGMDRPRRGDQWAFLERRNPLHG